MAVKYSLHYANACQLKWYVSIKEGEDVTYSAFVQVGESCQVGDKLIGNGIGVRHGGGVKVTT